MAENKGLTSRSLSALPLLLMGVTHLSLPPLQSMFSIEPMLMYAWYAVAILLGVVVYRRSGVVKDHEYNRAKAMRKIKHVYEAEEAGVWSREVALDGTMDQQTQMGLSRSISEISGEAPEMELDDEAKVEVRMLNEADHIVKADTDSRGYHRRHHCSRAHNACCWNRVCFGQCLFVFVFCCISFSIIVRFS